MRLLSTSRISNRPNAWMETDQGRKTESITHTRQHCVSSVCDRVHEQEGDDTSVRAECIVQPALQ